MSVSRADAIAAIESARASAVSRGHSVRCALAPCTCGHTARLQRMDEAIALHRALLPEPEPPEFLDDPTPVD